MTVHAIKAGEKKQLSNEVVFDCSREELLAIIEKYEFDDAVNFNMMVAIPPEREITKHGIILITEASETEQMRTSIGRVLSLGSSVGEGELMKDCKGLKPGDYVHYAFYAAGLPLTYKGIKIKFIVDDQVKCKIKNPDDVDKLYDYREGGK